MSASLLQGGHSSPELKFAQSFQPKVDPDSPEMASKGFTQRTRIVPRVSFILIGYYGLDFMRVDFPV